MASEDRIDELAQLRVARARAEAAEVVAMLAEADEQERSIDAADWTSMRRMIARQGVVLDLGQRTGRSEGQVVHLLAAARRVRSRTPRAWAAFVTGSMDVARVREVAHTLTALERPESWARLDGSVAAAAARYTVAEFRGWLKRFVARVEPDLTVQRSETAREQRRVEVHHDDDSMAWVNAFVPSHVAAAIDRRLDRAVRSLADDRTLDQRRADLLASWATSNTDTSGTAVAAPDTQIAVVIDAEVLAGSRTAMAISTDGSWAVPADWILESALAADPVWQRLLVDPISKDALAVESIGRFAPADLAAAIALRDGVCRAPGCLVPAQDCDRDHRVPLPEGATSADNLWSLCRRHHAMKGHGVLTWMLPSGGERPATHAEYGPPPRPGPPRVVILAQPTRSIELRGVAA